MNPIHCTQRNLITSYTVFYVAYVYYEPHCGPDSVVEDSRGFVHHNYYESVRSQSSAILLNDSCPIIPEPTGLGLEFPRLGQYRIKTNMATIHKASRARAKTIGLEFQRLGL